MTGRLFLFLLLIAGEPLFAQVKGDIRAGQDLYLEKCVLCHGSRGQGWDWGKKAEPPIPVPDLTKTVPQRADEYLFDIVKDGGESVGKTKFMPPFAFQLDDQDVRDIVAYLRILAETAR